MEIHSKSKKIFFLSVSRLSLISEFTFLFMFIIVESIDFFFLLVRRYTDFYI